MELIGLPDYPGCVKQGFEAPTRLPDGRLGYLVRCGRNPKSALQALYMMAYDLQTGEATPVLEYPLPSQHISIAGYSWNPHMTRGITDDHNGFAEEIYLIMPDHWEPLPLKFSRAITAVWSPNGEQIAFWGAAEQHVYWAGKAEATFDLYLMDPNRTDSSEVLVLLRGFRHPYSMSWSPDSRWLVFAASSGRGRQDGLWLVDVADVADVANAKLYLLAPGRFVRPIWSPDGQKIASIQLTDDASIKDLVGVEVGAFLQMLSSDE